MNIHNRYTKKRKRRHPRIIHQVEDTDPTLVDAILKNSRAMDAVSDDDRAWFAASPDRSYRLRPISEPERAIGNKAPPDLGVSNYVIVKQIKPGIRVRVSFKAYPLHRPENFSDNACAMLFADAAKLAPPDFVKALDMMKGL
jgi:hypothetical protein